GLSGEEGGEILEITAAAFRKRLSRAREQLYDFVKQRCGLVDGRNPCRCSLQVPYAVRQGMLDPEKLRFSAHPTRTPAGLEEIEGLLDAAALFRRHPDYAAPDTLVEALQGVLRR